MSFPSPSRRTLLRTASWGVPAVAVSAAAPAFATSTGSSGTVTVNGTSWTPEGPAWAYELLLSNNDVVLRTVMVHVPKQLFDADDAAFSLDPSSSGLFALSSGTAPTEHATEWTFVAMLAPQTHSIFMLDWNRAFSGMSGSGSGTVYVTEVSGGAVLSSVTIFASQSL